MPAPSASDTGVLADAADYRYRMHVNATVDQVVEAVTDETVITRWWTVWTHSARRAGEVQLWMGDEEPMRFVVDHAPGTSVVTWTVTACDVIPDWVGTTPSFIVRAGDDGTADVEFHHVGLRPALECFDQCQAGWDHFMPSLHRFLDTGTGLPNEPRIASD